MRKTGGRYFEKAAKKPNQSRRIKGLATSRDNHIRCLLAYCHSSCSVKLFFPLAVLDQRRARRSLAAGFGCDDLSDSKDRHKVWRYEVHENEIDIQSGIFVVTRVIVPMVRVQHVDTSQGPLLRKYNLATVKIFTAATVHSIPALEMEEADQLRDSISRLARVTDDDV